VNRFLVATILCAGFSWTGLAQSAADAPATKEDVEKYFDAVHSHDMMLKMVDAMSKSRHQMAHEQCAKDKDKLPADCEARMNKIMDDMMKQMPFDEMIQAMVPAYQKHFTKGDIEALNAFYSSPVGQKALDVLPDVTQEGLQAIMPILSKYITDWKQRMQEDLKQGASPAGVQKDAPASN